MNQSCKIPTTPRSQFPNFLFSGLFVLCMLGLLSPSVCSAQTWTGTTNTDWNVNTNWNTNAVPTGATVVQIPNTANKPVIGPDTDASAGTVKILSGGMLTIEGKLSLYPSTENGIHNLGNVVNNGELKMISANSSIFRGIYNGSVFTNNGTIEIAKASIDGIYSQGTFNNYGSIAIGTIGTIGENGIRNNGSFSNAFDGHISIDHADNGIKHEGGGFANGARIDIGGFQVSINHITGRGIHNKASFINMALGVINIDRTGGSCIFNETGSFSNAGAIILASQMLASSDAFTNFAGGTLTNDHCATLEANGALHNKGAINNLGLIKLNNYGGILPHFNTGVITNDGIIENIIGDAIPGTLINHDLIIKPNSGECIFENALQRGNETSFGVDGVWYFNTDLTSPAGNYNQSGNAFLQGNLNFGENTVFFLVQDDDYGCINMVSMAMTLLPDQTKPTVSCKQAVVEISASGSGVLNPVLLMESAEDDCGGEVVPVSVTPNTFSCAQIGQSIFATLTVSDESGNTSTCTATVTVKDVISPTMLCKPVILNLNAAGQATLTVAQIDNGSYDNCTIGIKVLSQSTFGCANLGVNTVTLSGVDAGNNKGVCSASIIIKDLIAPVTKCKSITANLAANGILTVNPSTVDNGSTDNCSLTLTLTPYSFNCGNVGVNNVTLRATDGSGNFSTCAATITVKDVTAPNALCKSATVILNDVGQGTLNLNQLNNGSSDACGIATMTLSKTQFNCSDLPGSSQSVTLSLVDVNNNQSACTAQVTVKDNLVPTAVCENTTVQLGSNGKVTVYPADLAANSFDNCSVTSYSPVAKIYTTANLGNNNLSITVKDWSNNGATCISVVTVYPYSGFRGGSGDRKEEQTTVPGSDFGFNVYPNPTAGDATVDFELSENQSVAMRVFDLTGRIVMNQQTEGVEGSNQIHLEMGAMPNGVYVVEIQADNARAQKRLVLQHD